MIFHFQPDLLYYFTILLTQRKVSQQQCVPTEAKDTKIHPSFEAKSNKRGIIRFSPSKQYSIDQIQGV